MTSHIKIENTQPNNYYFWPRKQNHKSKNMMT